MKSWSIAHRLLALFILVIALFLGGGAIFYRADERVARVTDTRERLLDGVANVRLALMTMSDAIRGTLLDPTSKEEHDRKVAADGDLAQAFEALKTLRYGGAKVDQHMLVRQGGAPVGGQDHR